MVKSVLLVFIFWSLPWTNGPNTQLKWKLRYTPIYFAYAVMFGKICACCYTGLTRENVQRNYRNGFRVRFFQLCQRLLVPLLCKDRGSSTTASIQRYCSTSWVSDQQIVTVSRPTQVRVVFASLKMDKNPNQLFWTETNHYLINWNQLI